MSSFSDSEHWYIVVFCRRCSFSLLCIRIIINDNGSPILETSVGFWSWSQSLAVSPQVTEAIKPVVGCHYFLQDLWLPPQPLSITAHLLVPNYTAWWQRHTCVNNLPRVAAWRLGLTPTTSLATKPHLLYIVPGNMSTVRKKFLSVDCNDWLIKSMPIMR